MAETIVAMDASLEVPMRDLWDLCKRTTSWVLEALRKEVTLVSYDETARVVNAGLIASLEYRAVYGANVHHALLLAKEMLVASEGGDKNPVRRIRPAISALPAQRRCLLLLSTQP